MAAQMINVDYYVGNLVNREHRPMSSFAEFSEHIRSIQAHNDRQPRRMISPQGTLLEERNKGTGVEFRHIMTADLVLYLAACKRGERWWPFTLVRAAFYSVSFEIFARAVSLAYFNKIKSMLGNSTVEDFRVMIKNLEEADGIPRFDYNRIDLGALVNAEKLGTRS